jgi:hypothetical protein
MARCGARSFVGREAAWLLKRSFSPFEQEKRQDDQHDNASYPSNHTPGNLSFGFAVKGAAGACSGSGGRVGGLVHPCSGRARSRTCPRPAASGPVPAASTKISSGC